MVRGGTGLERLPDDVRPYRRTPTFDQTTVPDGLRREHATKAGVWGVITVETGRLRYSIAADRDASWVLSSRLPGVVAPQELHYVELLDAHTQFHVRFYRKEGMEGMAP